MTCLRLARLSLRPRHPQALPPRRSVRALLFGLGLLLGLSEPAAAQTTHRSAGRQDADQRRAQREARRRPGPYADSHLQPGRRLRRGEGDQPRPEGSDLTRFENGNRPRAVKRAPLAGRRKHKPAH